MTIAVALPNWVGDVVMATPTLRALRRRFPDGRILCVGRRYVRPVLEPNPWTDAFLETDKTARAMWRTVQALRAEAPQTAVLLPNSVRSALLFWLAEVPRRIGYARPGRRRLLTDALEPPRRGRRRVPTPQVTYYLALAEVLGAPTDDRRLQLCTTEEDEAAALAAFGQARVEPEEALLLCPGYAFGPAKGWPVPHWAALARGARERFGLRALVLGGPRDADIARAIVQAEPSVVSLCDRGITLASARAVVRRARAMVTVDSGLRHYAAAFDRPVVALFGPTHIGWTETWHPKEVRLQVEVPCGPCQRPECPEGTLECMWKLEPDDVLDALAEALARDATGGEPEG